MGISSTEAIQGDLNTEIPDTTTETTDNPEKEEYDDRNFNILEDYPEKGEIAEAFGDIGQPASTDSITTMASSNTCSTATSTDLWNYYYKGYVDYSGDVDWYRGYRSGTNNLRFILAPPYNRDYDIEIYDNCSSGYVKKCNYGTGSIENCTATVSGYYYVKVYGYSSSDYSNSTLYRLFARRSGSCNIDISSGSLSKSTYNCNDTIRINDTKITNNNSGSIVYNYYHDLYTNNLDYYTEFSSTNKTLSGGSRTYWWNEFYPPSSGGWPSSGSYTTRAYLIAWCNGNFDLQTDRTYTHPNVSCTAGTMIGYNGSPSQSSFGCNETISTRNHTFKNTSNTYTYNFTVYAQLIDPNNNTISTRSWPGKSIGPGNSYIINFNFNPPSGGWTTKGTYKAKVWTSGSFTDGRSSTAYSYAYPYVPTAPCAVCSITGYDGSPTKSSFKTYENLTTQNHRFANTGNLTFTYNLYTRLFNPQNAVIASGSETNRTIAPGVTAVWNSTFSPSLTGWNTSGTYRAELKATGTCSDGTGKTRYSYASPVVENTCSVASMDSWVEQDGSCTGSIITKHKFVNRGNYNVPYNINFFLYNPNNELIGEASRSYTLHKNYSNTWTTTWSTPSGGWKPGTYRARAVLSGTCANNQNTIASNSASPSMPASCGGTCNGAIHANVKDGLGLALVNARVYRDGSYYGTTDSSGNITVPTTDSGCGNSHSIKVYCSEGSYCDTQSTTINFNNDNDYLYFACGMCRSSAQKLNVTASAAASYYLNDQIALSITVKDESGNLINGAVVSIYDPFKGTYASGTTTNGRYTYSTTASKTGTYSFNVTASKSGYQSGSASESVSVAQFNGNILVDVDNLKNKPINNAKVYVDGIYSGKTTYNGQLIVSANRGTHNVSVYCPNQEYCGRKSIYVNGSTSTYFDCGCTGNFRLLTETQEGYAIQNVYIFIDGEHRGTTAEFGALDLSDVLYGQHLVEVYFKIADNENSEPTMRYGSANVEFGADFSKKKFILVPESQSLTLNAEDLGPDALPITITTVDENAEAEFVPLVVVVLAAISIGFGVMDYGDYTKCVTESDDFWGSMGQYTWDRFRCQEIFMLFQDSQECREKMLAYNQRTINECKLQSAFLTLNFIPFGGILSKTVKVARWTVKGVSGLMHVVPHVDNTFKIIKQTAREVKFFKEGGQVVFKYIDDGFRLVKGKVFVIKDIARNTTIAKQIGTKIDLLKSIDVVPASIASKVKSIDGFYSVRGYLGEKATDKYISVVKAQLKAEGATVSVISNAAKAGEIYKETANYVFRYADNGGITIFKKGSTQSYGEIDRLMIVNGKPVVFEAKVSNYYARIMKKESMKPGHILNTKINPVKELTGETPEYMLVAAKVVGDGDIAKYSRFKEEIAKPLKLFGVDATADNFPRTVRDFDAITRDVCKALGGCGGIRNVI
jgi:hypothetical protein